MNLRSDPSVPFQERRRFPRYALKVALRLQGKKHDGHPFAETVATATVSAGGFSCNAMACLAEGGLIDVILIANGERLIGSAKLIRVGRALAPWFTYSFALRVPIADWFLVPED